MNTLSSPHLCFRGKLHTAATESVSWLHNNEPIKIDDKSSQEAYYTVETLEDSIMVGLHFRLPTARVTGNWTLIVTTADAQEHRAVCFVSSSPILRPRLGAVRGQEGKPLTVTCEVDSYPPPSRIRWRRLLEKNGKAQLVPVSNCRTTLKRIREALEDQKLSINPMSGRPQSSSQIKPDETADGTVAVSDFVRQFVRRHVDPGRRSQADLALQPGGNGSSTNHNLTLIPQSTRLVRPQQPKRRRPIKGYAKPMLDWPRIASQAKDTPAANSSLTNQLETVLRMSLVGSCLRIVRSTAVPLVSARLTVKLVDLPTQSAELNLLSSDFNVKNLAHCLRVCETVVVKVTDTVGNQFLWCIPTSVGLID
ncbi:unnamed protein product [Echinostoma caproni]|uniref:Ig-like domain-containing protein n=1 Tax=Echinostoma caproni TaxID=27848 RepID=A0A183AMR4_9TREM|nr:unnamed protein product [Echinostoma caproni]